MRKNGLISPNHSVLAGLAKVRLAGKTNPVEYEDHIVLATQLAWQETTSNEELHHSNTARSHH